jgi:tol-pal system protein YbgF
VIRRALILTLLAVAPLVPASAHAANKDIERLQLQIATLQSQLLDIQRTADDNRKEVRRLADLVAEQNALLQRVTSDRRQQDEAIATSLRDLGDRIGEVKEAIQGLKAAGLVALPPATLPAAGAATSGAASPGTPGAPEGASPAAAPPAPRELYSQAYADYARGNYDLAIQGFTEYIRNYPNTDFTDNAQYWIGECLYGKKMYAEAIEAWNTLFRDYTSSDKLPDARVKKGMALERLGRRSQALVEYRYVVDRFPNSPAARIARERLNP